MTPIPVTPETLAIARRLVWFKPADQALGHVRHLLAHAFRYGTASDIETLRVHLSDDDLREALENAPPGVIDARSWAYWRLMLDLPPKPLPRRVFD